MSETQPSAAADAPLRGEEAIIQNYLAPLAAGLPGAFGLSDDCAALSPRPGHDIVLKTDPVAEGVHFLATDDPADIGWKALAVNVSDLAAKGATPLAYLMALSFPEAPTRTWMARFAKGLGDAQTAFGIALAGGDTDRRPGPLSISITVLGEVPAGRMVRRGTARAGDVLFVTGTLGAAALGLQVRLHPALASQLGLSDADFAEVVARSLRPQPRLAIREALQAHARAAMDLSDGLAKDLGRLCRTSGCGAKVDLARLPLPAAVARAIRVDAGYWQAAVATGDDYEVLAAVAPEHADAFEAVGTAAGRGADAPFSITRIGRITAGTEPILTRPDGTAFSPQSKGWDHF
jgi:thiamine-monophosphate kinase